MNNRLVVSAFVTIIFAGLIQAQSYTPIDLGVLPTGLSSFAQAINDQGAVVGYCLLGNDTERAFFWSGRTGMRDLGTLKADTDSYAQAVNNSGQAAGVSYSRVTGVLHAFLWSQAKGMQDLGTLGGTSSFAYGINDQGEVVGASDLADSTFHAFRWTEARGMLDIGTLGGPDSTAVAVNNSGEIVGWSYLSDNRSIAFQWTQTSGMQTLGTLGGTGSTAYAVNQFGRVVGWANLAANSQEAFSWTHSHGMRSLGTGANSVALGINGSNAVVGYGSGGAFLWTSEVHEQLLNLLLPPNSAWNLSQATGINESGQIAANGTRDNLQRAALLTPMN